MAARSQVREIALEFWGDQGDGTGLRWQSEALLALQEAAEAYGVPLLMTYECLSDDVLHTSQIPCPPV